MELLPVLRYLLAFAVLAALGAPIAALGFRGLPRCGAAFALPTALVPFAIAVFWIGQVTFGVHAVGLAVLVLATGAVLAHRRGARPEWRAVASTYGVFALAFLFFVLVRAGRPGISPIGGEQFLHFALVNSLERAPSLPPGDVWYAGEPIRYYYGSQLQVLSFSMLTGTDPRYGFNLGIAAFYAVLVVVAYGLVGAIVARRGRPRRLGGILGVCFVALAGGTTTAIRLVTPYLPDAAADVVAPAAFGFVASRFYDGDLALAVAERADPTEWTWWYTRYVVRGTLQEVPFYSFVKADLHGHALSTGYVLFAGAVAYAYYITPAESRRRRAALLFGGLGAIAGIFGFMNTWALPTAGGLATLAVAAADPHPATLLPRRYESLLRRGRTDAGGGLRRLGAECWRLALAGLVGLVVVGIGVTIASPFLLFGQLPSNEGIGILPPRSPLGPFLVVYGGLLALFATYVLVRARPALAGTDRRVLLLGGASLLAAMVGTALWLDFAVLAVTGPLLLGAWALVRSDRGDFALVLFVAGVGLLLSFELVYARLPLVAGPRWNTSLKVAVQGWTLAAAGAGAAAAMLVGRQLERPRTADGNAPTRQTAEPATWLPVALVAVVVLASLVFPVMAAGQETVSNAVQGEYNGTLDGRERLEQAHPGQAAAVDWLDDRPGTPTIVEAPGPSYDWTSTAATFTGLPTVVGWNHQAEYRGMAAYERRVAHVDAIYTGPWPDAARHLARYDVRYVYVGPAERERYGEDLRSFDRPAFTVAFQNEAVTVYAVDQDHLPASERSVERDG